MLLSMEEEIKKLENEIESEEYALDICYKHPTDTNQFRSAMAKSAQRISSMKARLQELKDKKENGSTTN